jgi:predicted permease
MRPPRVRRLFAFGARTRRDVGKDVQEELQFHLEMRTADLRSDGMSDEEARKRALKEFGDVVHSSASLTRQGRQVERSHRFERFASEARQDAVYAMRLIARNKGFSLAAILTLGVAIGGNTAMFGVVNALFLQPLAIGAPHELVRIHTGESTVSWPNVDDIRRRNTVFTDVLVQGHSTVSLAAEPVPVVIPAGLVSMNYFSVLAAPPLAGRTPQPDDTRADVVVLSERLWRSRFGGSESIIGQTISIDGRPREVIGVMPAKFRGVAPPGLARQLWLPVDPGGVHRTLTTARDARRFEAYGRLAPGVSVEQAAAAMRVLGDQMAAEHPLTNARFKSMEVFATAGIGIYRGMGKALLPVFTFIGFLSVVGGFILLISCANLAGLLLGRAAARRREIAVRLALGAGRGRLIRQLLTESLVLALCGGAVGLLLAMVLAATLSNMAADLPFAIDLHLEPDRRVLAYTFGVSGVCALLFGLAPARRASRICLVDAIRGTGGDGSTRQRFRQGLIVAQVGVSALLLFWAGLFGRSLLHAGHVDLGFDPSGVLLAEVQLADEDAGALERADAALIELQRRAREFPGVEDAGWSSIVPLALLGNERFRISRTDSPTDQPGTWIVASRLTPGWFSTVRIPFVSGRDFTWQDQQGSPGVAIVNETLARRLWQGAAVGQRLRHGSNTAEIVGVVHDSKYWTLGEATEPTVYLPFRQTATTLAPTLHVRTTDLRGTAERLRQAVQELRPGAPAVMKPMSDAVALSLLPARAGALVTGAFGLLGALLATFGVYGLISYIVVQRSREVAIRRAIGAPTGHIVRIVVGSSIGLSIAGLALGLAAGSVSAPLLGGLLVDVSPRDPIAAAATALIVLATAALASVPPALRAARVDPLATLKTV